jgi:hypothetical protein
VNLELQVARDSLYHATQYAHQVLPLLELVISEPANLSALGAIFETHRLIYKSERGSYV